MYWPRLDAGRGEVLADDRPDRGEGRGQPQRRET